MFGNSVVGLVTATQSKILFLLIMPSRVVSPYTNVKTKGGIVVLVGGSQDGREGERSR